MKLKEAKTTFRAFSDETRLRILNLLSNGELCVCDIMTVLKAPQSKVSRHLGYLRQRGLVLTQKKGLWIYYRLSDKTADILKEAFHGLTGGVVKIEELSKDNAELKKNKSSLISCCK